MGLAVAVTAAIGIVVVIVRVPVIARAVIAAIVVVVAIVLVVTVVVVVSVITLVVTRIAIVAVPVIPITVVVIGTTFRRRSLAGLGCYCKQGHGQRNRKGKRNKLSHFIFPFDKLAAWCNASIKQLFYMTTAVGYQSEGSFEFT
jgi:hypothetical protein